MLLFLDLYALTNTVYPFETNALALLFNFCKI